jgi:hypothetical protein
MILGYFSAMNFSQNLCIYLEILLCDNVASGGELNLLKCVQLYAKDNNLNLKKSDVWKEILPVIRFPFLSIHEITTDVFAMNILSKNEIFDLMIFVGSNGKSTKTTFPSIPRKIINFTLDGEKSLTKTFRRRGV